jgi:hypothetical protein
MAAIQLPSRSLNAATCLAKRKDLTSVQQVIGANFQSSEAEVRQPTPTAHHIPPRSSTRVRAAARSSA